MATNNVTNDGTRTAHAIPIMQGVSTPNYATLTNGQLLIGNTGNDPSAASITAGSGITVTPGAGTITIASSGGVSALTLLASATAAGTPATLDFANLLSATYDFYLVLYENLNGVSADVWQFIFGTGGTPTWQTTNYSGVNCGNNAATTFSGNASSTTAMNINGVAPTTNTSHVGGGFGYITNANSATTEKVITGNTATWGSTNSNDQISSYACRWQDSTTAISSLRFLCRTGNINTATVKLYGVKN